MNDVVRPMSVRLAEAERERAEVGVGRTASFAGTVGAALCGLPSAENGVDSAPAPLLAARPHDPLCGYPVDGLLSAPRCWCELRAVPPFEGVQTEPNDTSDGDDDPYTGTAF